MSRCEAMVLVKGRTKPDGVYMMCGAEDADLHHKLTRGRGGTILDIAKETYHQMYLCREHHQMAHDEGIAFHAGLLIAGYVITAPDGKPLYNGPDPYLTEHYGNEGLVRS